MRLVAEHLEKEALKRRKRPDELDSFARSAFNRYYYATFLQARLLIRQFKPAWRGTHGGLPADLVSVAKRDIGLIKNKAQRSRDWEVVDKCEICTHHLHGLSELLQSAYAIRVTADYEPDILATIEKGGAITMGQKKITEAKNWPVQAANFSGKIEGFWSKLNGY